MFDPFTVIWDPSTSAFKRSFYTAQLEVMKKYYSPMIPLDSKITVFILGSDKAWGTQQLTAYASAHPDFEIGYATSFMVSSKCSAPDGWIVNDAQSPDPYSTYRGWGGGSEPKIGDVMVAFSNCDVSNETDILFHEVFHAVQWMNTYITSPFQGRQSWGNGTVATWLHEGQAEYFGLLLKEDFQWKSFSRFLIRWWRDV